MEVVAFRGGDNMTHIYSKANVDRFKSSGNRIYTLLGCSNLLNATRVNVPGCGPSSGSGGANSMSDTNIPGKGPFYRMEVKLP